MLDFVLAFMWVWSGTLIKIFVFGTLGFGNDPVGEIVKASFSILNMFVFAFLSKIWNGASYNPLNILSDAFSGDSSSFLFLAGARIPAQVLFPLRFVSVKLCLGSMVVILIILTGLNLLHLHCMKEKKNMILCLKGTGFLMFSKILGMVWSFFFCVGGWLGGE